MTLVLICSPIITSPLYQPALDFLPQQLEDSLGGAVGLGQDGHACLLKNLRSHQPGALHGDVGIADAGLGSGEVLHSDAQAGDGVLQTVLDSTEVRSGR